MSAVSLFVRCNVQMIINYFTNIKNDYYVRNIAKIITIKSPHHMCDIHCNNFLRI